LFYPILILAAVMLPACMGSGSFGTAAYGAEKIQGADQEKYAKFFPHLFPKATYFGGISGSPPSVPVFNDQSLIGYVFFSRQVSASVGYSGKPLNVLVGLDLEGTITGVRIVEHHEPILAIGITDKDLKEFTRQYVGLNVRNPVRITRNREGDQDDNTLDAVSGASISSIVLNDAIIRSARAVARSRGLLGKAGQLLDFDQYSPASWQELLEEGSIVERHLTIKQAASILASKKARLFPGGGGPTNLMSSFIDLSFGLATPARVGRNLIGRHSINEIVAGLSNGDQLLFLAANGYYSFRGRAFRKIGYFDRISVVQGEQSFRLTKNDYVRIDQLQVAGAPEFREIAIFKIRKSSGFKASEPWRLDLTIGGEKANGEKAFSTISTLYKLPKRYFRKLDPSISMDERIWLQVWEERFVEIVVLVLALTALTGFFFFQDWGAQRQRLYDITRLFFLVFTVIGLGWYTDAQLSVINVLTFMQSLLTEFRWDFFLLEPLIFILWGGTALSLLFWGRGAFCGWLCPFGAMQELLAKFAQFVRLPQLSLPWGVHERLWPLKYIVFVGLFALFLGDEDLALMGTEIEPFKTAIVMGFDRAWPFVLYAAVLLGVGLFINRFFCRYICPLGAALAIPARVRMFEWLKRRWQCGLQCHICADKCPIQAIHPDGHINPNECIYCLNCQVIYHDDSVCPPLVEKRKRNEMRLDKSLVKRFEKAEQKGEQADSVERSENRE